MPTPSIQTLVTDAQQILNLDSISAIRSVVAVALANANTGTPLNPNLTTQQLWNEFYQVVTKPKSDIESIIANQLMKLLYSPPAPGGVGANGQVIFNDGGVLAGDPQLLWNKTTNLLTVTGSATITGDLTVDTSTLKVDSANNRVGVLTASPSTSFHTQSDGVASGAGWTAIGRFNNTAQTKGVDIGYNPSNNNAVITALSGGTASGFEFWSFDSGWATRMTLNSTGLGVGGSPFSKLSIIDTTNNFPGCFRGAGGTNFVAIGTSALGASINGYTTGFGAAADLILQPNGGNVGVGVTPSASTVRTVQSQYGVFVGNDELNVASNAYFGSSWKYVSAATAARYSQAAGVHYWFTAAAGAAANDPITTFAAANAKMTLDASGNLLVGTTSALASGSTFQNLGINRQVLTLKGDTAVSYTSGIWNASTTGDALFQYFGTETTLTVRGGISYNRAGGLVSYNTTSDYRAKDIIGPISNSGSLIDSLKVYVGKMKGATVERPMLIAHEAQEVAPYAVTGTKDEVDADGNPKYQQMDVSSFIPLLIAEIQSLRTRVEALEA
jgi:hypothetical protein